MFIMRENESRNRNLLRFLEQSLELVSVFFKDQARNFIFIFILKNLKTIFACPKKY
jgi:hypothetical protein